MNVYLQPNTVTDLYAATGITAGTALVVYNNGPSVVKLGTTAASITDGTDYVNLPPMKSATSESGINDAHAYSLGGADINVSEV